MLSPTQGTSPQILSSSLAKAISITIIIIVGHYEILKLPCVCAPPLHYTTMMNFCLCLHGSVGQEELNTSRMPRSLMRLASLCAFIIIIIFLGWGYIVGPKQQYYIARIVSQANPFSCKELAGSRD